MLPVLGQARQVPLQLNLAMTISASNSGELRIEFLPDRVLDFKTLDISLAAVKTTWVWGP
jgi:hypothetical protein